MLIVVVACIENTQRRTSFQSPFDVTASTSTSDSNLGGGAGAAIKSTETSAIVVAAVDSELLTPAEEPQLNSAAETAAAAADDCEMSGRRVAETGGKTFYFVVVKCGFGTISGSYQRLTTQEKISQSD